MSRCRHFGAVAKFRCWASTIHKTYVLLWKALQQPCSQPVSNFAAQSCDLHYPLADALYCPSTSVSKAQFIPDFETGMWCLELCFVAVVVDSHFHLHQMFAWGIVQKCLEVFSSPARVGQFQLLYAVANYVFPKHWSLLESRQQELVGACNLWNTPLSCQPAGHFPICCQNFEELWPCQNA